MQQTFHWETTVMYLAYLTSYRPQWGYYASHINVINVLKNVSKLLNKHLGLAINAPNYTWSWQDSKRRKIKETSACLCPSACQTPTTSLLRVHIANSDFISPLASLDSFYLSLGINAHFSRTKADLRTAFPCKQFPPHSCEQLPPPAAFALLDVIGGWIRLFSHYH